MRNSKPKNSSSSVRDMRPALTPEAEENRLISLATDLAAQQLMDGTASSQVITHFLKVGSTRERLEMERLTQENELLKAKTESLQSAKKVEELYAEAMSAFRHYSGNDVDDVFDDGDDYDY